MFDYTPEGLKEMQSDIALAYLNLIDKKLGKIKRRLTVITLVVVATAIYKNKDVIEKINNMKGEYL